MQGSALSEQARFFRRVQETLRDLADAAGDYAAAIDQTAGAGELRVEGEAELPEARGKRQQEMVDVLFAEGGEDGLKTGNISARVGMDSANGYLTLQALAKQDLVERVPGVEPQHWRLTPRYRLSRRIVEVGGLVRPGEWTSYGDISQVVYGHAKAGQAVGMVVSRSPECEAFAHRVLQFTGQIPSEWFDEQGRRPEECARRLREEGVTVDEDLFAHGRHHVTHEELSRRLGETRGGGVAA